MYIIREILLLLLLFYNNKIKNDNFVKINDTKIIHYDYIKWMEKINECIFVCDNTCDCNFNNIYKICKNDAITNYNKLDKFFY